MGFLRTEIADRVAILTLDDPGRRNALSLAMAEEIAAALDAIVSTSDAGAVVLTGRPPAFSAGADLADLEHASRDRLSRIYEGFLAVARCPLPTLAAVNGAAVGAGLNLALACDVRIAGRSARFESRFLDLALHPGGGHTFLLRRLVGPQGAAAIALLGEPLDGEQAARRGLAWACVEDAALLDAALALARRAAEAPPELVRRLKETLRAVGGVRNHDEAVALELEAQLWSVGREEFRTRLAALKRRIERSRTP